MMEKGGGLRRLKKDRRLDQRSIISILRRRLILLKTKNMISKVVIGSYLEIIVRINRSRMDRSRRSRLIEIHNKNTIIVNNMVE